MMEAKMEPMMETIAIRPFIRVAHHYRFPAAPDRTVDESSRVGYCYAFHYVDGGRGAFGIRSKTYAVQKGDLLYIPPGCKHSFESDPAAPLTTYNIYCELWTDAPQRTPTHLVWDEASFDAAYATETRAGTGLDAIPPVVPPLAHSVPTDVIPAIVRHHQTGDSVSEAIACSLLKALVLSLVQAANRSAFVDPRIANIVDELERGAAAGEGLEAWLARAGLRKTQFHRLFKQATGLSPKAYRTRAVMKQAAAALLETNRSVTAVAADLGFASIHHFTKQFTAYHGASPTQYRRASRSSR